jgi:isocitrate lyase
VAISAEKRFRKMLKRPSGLFAFGIYDAMSAKIGELAGHECLYAGGYSAAGSRGRPDMGILSATEMYDHFRFISEATKLPVIADIDDGYGGVHNVERIVRLVLSLKNVVAVHLEDQKLPKRCGHLDGKEVIPIAEFLPKLKVAIDTRNAVAPDKVIVARTDAFGAANCTKEDGFGGAMSEAVNRSVEYAIAGADVVWCEFPTAEEKTIRAFSERFWKSLSEHAFKRPTEVWCIGFNVSPSFSVKKWEESTLTTAKLAELGCKMRFSTYPALKSAMLAVYDTARDFAKDEIEAIRHLQKKAAGTPVENVNKVLDIEQYLAREQQYDPKAKERHEASRGGGVEDVASLPHDTPKK